MAISSSSSPHKVCLIGESQSGKTSLLRSLMGESSWLEDDYSPTVGANVQRFKLNETEEVEIWDCAGDERFKGLDEGYYLQSQQCLIVTTPTSLFTLPWWIKKIRSVEKDIPILIIVNKCDKEVLSSHHKKMLKSFNLPWCQVSAKDRTNLNSILSFIVR
jgi:GTP-binding nuclear protein Ran